MAAKMLGIEIYKFLHTIYIEHIIYKKSSPKYMLKIIQVPNDNFLKKCENIFDRKKNNIISLRIQTCSHFYSIIDICVFKSIIVTNACVENSRITSILQYNFICNWSWNDFYS